MANSKTDSSTRWTADQWDRINKDIDHVLPMAEFLVSKKALASHDLEQLRKLKGEAQRSHFTMLMERKYAPDLFIEALVATNQYELAKALKPDLIIDRPPKDARLSSGDGNCIGRPKKENDEERSIDALTESTESITLEPPSAGAIKENENYYHVEKELYVGKHGVPETDGLLGDLEVTMSSTLPPGFNYEKCYPHFSSPKGLAIIFNNRRFKRTKIGANPYQLPLPERLGTDVDCKNLQRLLTQLGYHVSVKSDFTAKEMHDAMAQFSFKSEHEQSHSAVVVVLTHGTQGQMYGSDEELIRIETFVQYLNGQTCPMLKGKPKIFIIQACRGDHYDEGVDGLGGLRNVSTTDAGANGKGDPGAADGGDHGSNNLDRIRAILAGMDETDAKNIAKTPTDADILIAYATTPGYVSWRNTVRGSWFIQAICEVFAREAYREEILHLFTEVNRKVSENLSGTGHMQVPEPSSRLTRKFYIMPGFRG